MLLTLFDYVTVYLSYYIRTFGKRFVNCEVTVDFKVWGRIALLLLLLYFEINSLLVVIIVISIDWISATVN